CSASVERICPTARGDVAANWAASPLPATPKPSGTPGAPNSNYSSAMPPVILVTEGPAIVAPGQPLVVKAKAANSAAVAEMTLLYRVMTAEKEGAEVAVPMAKAEGETFAGQVPAQAAGSVVRYRVKVVGEAGAARFDPAEN